MSVQKKYSQLPYLIIFIFFGSIIWTKSILPKKKQFFFFFFPFLKARLVVHYIYDSDKIILNGPIVYFEHTLCLGGETLIL